MADVDITRRQAGKIQNLITGVLHNIQVKTRFQVHMVEMEDVNFHHDSAVLLPDYGSARPVEGATPEQDRITGLAVLYACYRQARANPEQALLVIGHTDRSGPRAYNQTLSELRAKNVRFALQGDRTRWVESTLQKNKVEDYQQILIWLTHSLGWNCDPGPKDNKHGPDTSQAVRDFKQQYNDRFSASLAVNGVVNRETWGAFFDVYMEELKHALGTDDGGLDQARQSLRFLTCESIGCGEDFPITPDRQENYKNVIDRRVEILFFDSGEEPVMNCSRPGPTCEELYGLKMYDPVPVTVDPLPLPSGVAVNVFLQFFFLDPGGEKRHFPTDFPVTLVFDDGTTNVHNLGAEGLLNEFVLREKKSFTIRFEMPLEEATYIATPPGDSGASEWITPGEVKDRLERGYRLFLLPSADDWSLKTSTWSPPAAPNFSDDTFGDLETVQSIGSAAFPVEMLLDPNWQYVMFSYFDRLLKKRLSVPQLMIEGASDEVLLTIGLPDTRSNWFVGDSRGCQCLPWIVQTPPRPDQDTALQFRTAGRVFVESAADGTRRLVRPARSSGTINPFEDLDDEDEPPFDSELNAGGEEDFNPLTVDAERLRYYDLPPIWRSRRYHSRLLRTSDGDEADKRGTFEEMASERTSATRPLMVSLDDMVLVRPGTSNVLEPIEWKPEDRVALFSHTFAKNGNPKLTDYGLFDPEPERPYLSRVPDTFETDRNYIADHPEWTRLAFARGNLFTVFDARTPDVDGQVVGARAAVLEMDCTDTPPSRTEISLHNRDVTLPFFAMRSFFRQIHAGGAFGRCEVAVLRCCDREGDVEVAQIVQYHRFSYEFADPELPEDLRTDVEKQRRFGNTGALEIMKRWNGPIRRFNPRPAVLIPEDPANELTPDPARRLKIRVLWFVQVMPEIPISHFIIEVKKDVRAFMRPARGTGAMEPDEIRPDRSGNFTSAHETGHAASLDDEYIESSTSASYFQPGFDSPAPGGPYNFDVVAMMRGNREIRTRYFWHYAEWLRSLEPDGGFYVEQGRNNYRLPRHASAFARSYANFPLEERPGQTLGDRGMFDWYLYALGDDQYSRNGYVPGHLLDGMLVIVVKLKLTFHTNDLDDLRDGVGRIRREIFRKFNDRSGDDQGRWFIRGQFGTRGREPFRVFRKCALVFSPRFLVTNFPDNERDAERYARRVDVRRPESGDYDHARTKEAYGRRVQEISDSHTVGGVQRFFDVQVESGSFFRSGSATFEAQRRLRIAYNTGPFSGSATSQIASLLVNQFPRMVGIDKDAGSVAAADLTGIANLRQSTGASGPIIRNARVNEF